MLEGILANLTVEALKSMFRRLLRWRADGGTPASSSPKGTGGAATQLAPTEKASWLGRDFLVYEYPQRWRPVSGLYVFACRNPEVDEGWTALLVAATGDFEADLADPERWPEAQGRGATHIHVHAAPAGRELGEYRRRFIEQFQPPMNVEAARAQDDDAGDPMPWRPT